MDVLLSEIEQFQSLLKEDQDIQLCANGSNFIISGLRCRGDYLIFEGLTYSNAAARLIVNIHQLNFSLQAVPRYGSELHRIGFVAD